MGEHLIEKIIKGPTIRKGAKGGKINGAVLGTLFCQNENRFHFVKMLLFPENILTNCWTWRNVGNISEYSNPAMGRNIASKFSDNFEMINQIMTNKTKNLTEIMFIVLMCVRFDFVETN